MTFRMKISLDNEAIIKAKAEHIEELDDVFQGLKEKFNCKKGRRR